MFKFFRKKENTVTPDINKQQTKSSGLFNGLKRTRDVFVGGISKLFSVNKKSAIDQQLLNELKEKLLMADVGVEITSQVLEQLKNKIKSTDLVETNEILLILKNHLEDILEPCNKPLIIPKNPRPFVILTVGVNGAGKTTTIGKLAKKLQEANYKVMLAAGDTFRAAAIEQLKVWGERNNITVIAQKQGGDSSAVLYDALKAAQARQADILIIDTAGRLHTQENLMEELKKNKRTLQKIDPSAPHETLLILDATVGQNALNQAKIFNEAIGISGICITKLDGTAKGGIIFAIAKNTNIPIRLVGFGESINDLVSFDAKEFAEALFH